MIKTFHFRQPIVSAEKDFEGFALIFSLLVAVKIVYMYCQPHGFHVLKITSDLHLSFKGGTFELHNKYTDSLARAEVSFKDMKPGDFYLVLLFHHFNYFIV